MKHYNRSLDYVALAMAHGRNGNVEKAAKLFAKAIAAPDAVRAVAILETSNKMAFAKVQAAAKKETAAAAKAAPAKEVKAAAKAPVTAKAKPTKVEAEFDMGEDDDIDDLVADDEEDDGEDDAPEDDSDDEVDAGAEDDEDEETFDEQFAAVLSSLQKPKSKKAK